MRNWLLTYLDGDFEIVFPPPLLAKVEGRLIFKAKQIRAYHLELLRRLMGENVWATDLRALDLRFYSQNQLFYRKIGELIFPRIDVERLEPISRHEFFVCTAPIEHPETGQVVSGLSGLEQLMGYAYVKQDVARQSVQPTTGDSELDVLTDALLVFKRKGLELAQILSLEELAKANRQAGERMRPPESEVEDEAQEELEVDDALFLANKDAILSQIQQMGVLIPPGF